MKAARAEMLPSGWVTPERAPGEKSFQSKSGLVRAVSCRNLFRGWYQPAFQKRFFSTWSEVKKASMPPEFAVISTVIFWRAWISGSVSHLTFIPESVSNSGMCFSSTSMNGCLVSSRKSSLPSKRFQVKPCARSGVHTKGPAAAHAATVCKKARRVIRRAAMGGSPLVQSAALRQRFRAGRHRSIMTRCPRRPGMTWLERLDEAAIRWVRIAWGDHAGLIRAEAAHRRLLDDGLPEGVGITVAQQALPVMFDAVAPDSGLGPIGEARLIPDWSTLALLPWAPGHAQVMGDMMVDGAAWEHCPREYLRTQARALAAAGFSARAAFENEFFLLRRAASGLVAADDTVYAAT